MTSSIRHGAASARGPRRPLDVVTALAATALLIGPGMMLFAWPPGADEARLQLWARALSGGAVFYRDLWDGTQPGLAWFYQLGHALPAGELGPRILLLVLVLVAGRLLYGAMSRAHAHPLTRAFGPAAVFAPVLLLGERGGVGHVEGVVVALLVPQVVLTGLLDDPDDRMPSGRRRWSLAATWGTAGVFAGILAVFEVTYLSISGVLLTGAVALAWRRGAGRERLTGGLLGYVAGATAPIGAALGYLTWHGVAGAAWHAAVTLRVAAWSEGVSGEPVRALLSALPLLTLPVLACLVAAEALARHRQVRRRWLPAGVTFAAALLAAVVCLALPGSGAQAGPLLAGIIAVPALLGLDALARRPSPPSSPRWPVTPWSSPRDWRHAWSARPWERWVRLRQPSAAPPPGPSTCDPSTPRTIGPARRPRRSPARSRPAPASTCSATRASTACCTRPLRCR